MSSTVNVGSAAQFRTVLSSSTIVITDFYADWCGPCKQISPIFEQLSAKYSKPKSVTFTKVNVDSQQSIAQQYSVTAMPTFLIFRSGSVIQTIQGADPRNLTSAIENAVKIAAVAKPTYSYSSAGHTLGGSPVSSMRTWRWSFTAVLKAIYTFLGLYFISLFSLDPFHTAETSPFNIHREPPRPNVKITRNLGTNAGAAPIREKRFGTINDITGGS